MKRWAFVLPLDVDQALDDVFALAEEQFQRETGLTTYVSCWRRVLPESSVSAPYSESPMVSYEFLVDDEATAE